MATEGRPCVAFLALCRASDGAVLASRFDKATTTVEKADFEAMLGDLLQKAKKLAHPGWRESCCRSLDGAEASVLALADQQGLAVLAVGLLSMKYPGRVAEQLLRELNELVRNSHSEEVLLGASAGSLTASLKGNLRDLMKSYKDPAAKDQVAQAQEKVQNLQVVMQDNVRQILESHASVAYLQAASQSMTAKADKFMKQSAHIKQRVQLRNLKVKGMLSVTVMLLALYFVLLLF